jgi:UDP-3-O-[3-hydroxymyristoyl] N-acetylglucosamine deacetylase
MSSVQILPCENPGNGIVFRDDQDGQEIAAQSDNVSGTSRCTALASGGKALQTVEHLLSACAGLGVTDAVVRFQGGEIPALDGSALLFAEAIVEAGIVPLAQKVAPIVLGVPLVVQGKGTDVLVFVPAERFWATVVLDYPDRPALGAQVATYCTENQDAYDLYLREIAPARTYGFLSELDQLKALGLALGASAENAVALQDDGSPDERTPFRFPNEMARHKLLDLLGDLSLVGHPLRCGILAMRPSHALNALGAKMLAHTLV